MRIAFLELTSTHTDSQAINFDLSRKVSLRFSRSICLVRLISRVPTTSHIKLLLPI